MKKYDMSKTCNLKYFDMYGMCLKHHITSEEFSSWYDQHCGQCKYMCEICMYGEEVPQDEELQENICDNYYDDYDENECDVFQIGGICNEKNCAHCVNHSGFCPVSMEDLDQLIYGGWDDYKNCE